jgi:hypothetical protein
MKCEFRWASTNPRPMSTCNGDESRRRLASSVPMAEPYTGLGWPLLGWTAELFSAIADEANLSEAQRAETL